MIIVPGRNQVIELLRSKIECEHVYVDEQAGKDSKIEQVINLSKNKGTKISFVNRKFLQNKAKDLNHQGVVAMAANFAPSLSFDDIEASLSNKKTPFYIYLPETNHDHNAGAIIRTAECLGVDGIIMSTKLEQSSTLVRMSTGANFHIPVMRLSVFNAIKQFKDLGFNIVAIEINGNKMTYEYDFNQPTLCIIGSEDKGVTPQIQEKVDTVLQIPQSGYVNSLNMSVATGIIMYERIRQLAV